MPEISRFLGMVIAIYFNDHGKLHFHVTYGSHRAAISLVELGLLEGDLPPKALGLVIEWAALHREELMHNWQRARCGQPLEPVAPLE